MGPEASQQSSSSSQPAGQHPSPDSQLVPSTPAQRPAEHWSSEVQEFPSSQVVPSSKGSTMQVPRPSQAATEQPGSTVEHSVPASRGRSEQSPVWGWQRPREHSSPSQEQSGSSPAHSPETHSASGAQSVLHDVPSAADSVSHLSLAGSQVAIRHWGAVSHSTCRPGVHSPATHSSPIEQDSGELHGVPSARGAGSHSSVSRLQTIP